MEFKSGVKVEFKWSFEVDIWNPSFYHGWVKTGIQKVDTVIEIASELVR